MLFSLLLVLSLQQGSDQLAQTTFTMGRGGLQLEPATQAILLADQDGLPVEFTLSFDGEILPAMRFQGSLVGPGLATPHLVDVPAEDGRITLSRAFFTQVGVYRLMNVRLSAGGETLTFAQPDVAEIQVAENFVVSEVQVNPLDQQELIDRGYLFSEDDYFSVEFNLALTIGSKEEHITVPVAYPKKHTESYEPVVLDDPFKPYVRMLAFKRPFKGGMLPGYLKDPPATQNYAPGLILIPGNFNYLKSHFEVTALVLNAAPSGFDVSVEQLESRIILPDPTIYGTPLSIRESVSKPMSFLGADNTRGTTDDRDHIQPGEQAQSDYVVIGNIPGMYDVQVEIKGLLNLPGTTTDINTLSQGQIFVRSPQYSVDFEHPDAVAEDESYDMTMTVTNRGEIPLEGFSVTLDPDTLVGTELNGSHPVQSLTSVPVDGSGTVTWTLRAKNSGRVISNYFKLEGDAPGALHLRTGVGETGQKISPYVLFFPQVFYDEFPAALTSDLRRYAKTALDFSQMTAEEMPAGLTAITPTAVREFNEQMTLTAQSTAFGVNDDEQLARLFQLWVRGVDEYAPLDLVRRHMIANGIADMEAAFGAAFQTTFTGVTDGDMLRLIARENESTPHLFAAVVQTSTAATLRVHLDGRTNEGVNRPIPFSSILPLGPNRHLVWVSASETAPQIEVVPADADNPGAVTINALFPNADGSQPHLAESISSPLNDWGRITFDTVTTRLTLTTNDSVPLQTVAHRVDAKPFELMRVRQAEPKIYGGADKYGRDFIISFSKALDLSSLDPIEEHVFINGDPVVDAKLQKDGRTLLVSSRMPLGPYHAIAYEIRNPKSVDEQDLGVLQGEIQGSSWYTGVSISGKIVDRNGHDLREAAVFHWRETKEGWFIFDKTLLDGQDRYLFEFSPYLPYSSKRQPLRIGVLLSDGRYEEREFFPRGVGQELVADFSFLQQGTVTGTVRDQTGDPVPFAKIFAVNQANELSAVETTADENGVYHARGLEVGSVLIKSAHQGIVGYASGYLTQTNSPLTVDVVIANPSATISGVITAQRASGIEPQPYGYVAFLLQDGLAGQLTVGERQFPYSVITRADENGEFRLENVPAGNGYFWVFDGEFGYFERLIVLADGELRVEDHQFDGTPIPTGSISGIVRTSQGQTLAGVRVATSGRAVTTANDGSFILQDLYRDSVYSLYAEHPDFGIGSAGVSLDGETVENVEIVLQHPIQISGRYVDQEGRGVPFAFIYKPPYGIIFEPLTQTDRQGYWSATLAEPGVHMITTMDTPTIAAIPELNVPAEGLSNILLTQTPKADLRVRLVDENGRPIIAKIDVDSMMPSPFTGNLGAPIMRPTHRDHFADTDGEYIFRNLNIGPFTVFGHNEQFGETELFEGVLAQVAEGEEPQTVTLVFPNTLDPANLFGQVFGIDGVTPAPPGTIVQVTGPGLNASDEVDADGNYRFETLVQTQEPVRLNVIASHPEQGIFDTAWFELHQDLNFRYDLNLKREGSVRVSVINGDGTPVDFALVQISYRDVNYSPPTGPDPLGFFKEVPVTEQAQITPDTQSLTFSGVPQGEFTLSANTGAGLVAMRSFVIPVEERDLDVVLKLEASSSITGLFLDHNSAPIADAEIRLLDRIFLLQQKLSSSEAGEEGSFQFAELPMRDYKLFGVDPATALEAHLDVTTSPYRPNPEVQLNLDPVGDLEGLVLFNGEPVTNARVEIEGRGSTIITGSDAEGRYRFRNLPLGDYRISADSTAVIGTLNTGVSVSQAFAVNEFNLNFGETRTVELYVAASDGSPAAGVLVTAENLNYRQVVGNSAYTNEAGVATLTDLAVGSYRVSGEHPTEVVHLDAMFMLTEADPDPSRREVAFRGYGQIHGTVTDTGGLNLEQPIHLIFEYTVNAEILETTITSDATGNYRIGRIPVGALIKVTAYNQTTQEVATRRVTLEYHGEQRREDMVFRSSTYASGTVVFENGDAAAGAEVWIEEPYRMKIQTDASGFFYLQPILDGATTIYAKDTNSQRTVAHELTIDMVGGLPIPAANLTLTLGGIADVSGQVSYSNGDVLRSGRVELTHLDLNQSFRALIQGDGSYHFSQIPLGDYSLIAHDRTYDKDSAPVSASATQDGAVVNVDIAFEESYQLTGRLFAPNGVDPSPRGEVELWRQRHNDPEVYDLVYAEQSDENGYYLINHIYPGNYRIEAGDAAREGSYQDTHLMRTEDMNRDVYLQSRAWLLGTLADAENDPYTSGDIQLSQNGRTYTTRIGADGAFRFENLTPGPYSLNYTVSGGWYSDSHTGILSSGANTAPLTTPTAATIEGRVILIRDPAARPGLSFRIDRTYRSVIPDADGRFALNEVPADLPIEMVINYAGVERIEIVNVSADTDIGLFYLDSTPPQIDFADAGGQVTDLPYDLAFDLTESDPQSEIDPTATRVWVNDQEITQLFNPSAGGVVAQFTEFPSGFVLGANTLRVRTANRHRAHRESQFTLNLNLSGVSLSVDLVRDGGIDRGQIRLNDGAWTLTDENGRVTFTGVPPGDYTIKARNSQGGARTLLGVGSVLHQLETMTMTDVGSYAGRVLIDTDTPLAGAIVRIGDQIETTDQNGAYLFDQLPLDAHGIYVAEQDLTAFLAGPELTANGQTVADLDLLLEGVGSVSGSVRDDNGEIVTNARIILTHDDFPADLSREVTTTDGSFTFEGVKQGGFRLTAVEIDSGRSGLIQAEITNPGDVITADITLSPAGNLSGIVLDMAGNPAAGITVYAQGPEFDFTVVTDEQGRFLIANMPYGAYQLTINHPDAGQYLIVDQLIDSDNLDLGNLDLIQDQAPEILAFEIPQVYDIVTRPAYRIAVSDDRQIRSIQIYYEGVYTYHYSHSIHQQSFDDLVRPHVPTTAPEGQINWRLEVIDSQGQTTTQTGIMTLAYQSDGPTVAITQPQNGSVHTEGTVFEVAVTATDPALIQSVSATFGSVDLGILTQFPYTFTATAPGVTETTTVPLVVTATNTRGLSTSVTYDLLVNSTNSAGGPNLDLLAPLPGMALPLTLEDGLILQFAADAQDDDGLESVTIRVAGEDVLQAPLSGTSARIYESWLLPESLRGESDLLVEMIVRDQGGNPSVAVARIQNLPLDGVTIANADKPLIIQSFDVSYRDHILLLAGGTHIIDGAHRFADLILVNNARLTQTGSTDQSPASTDITLTGELVIDYNSAVDLSEAGYEYMPPGFGFSGHLRGSHGGLGAGTDDYRNIYGSPFQPTMPGSGYGGGAVKFNASTFWLAGNITADSNNGTGSSGGSVWLVGDTYYGKGRISANGFSGDYTQSGNQSGNHAGAGGRVAIEGPYTGTAQAFGGVNGGAGTTYYKQPLEEGGYNQRLIIANYPDATTTNGTGLRTLNGLVAGTDFTSEIRTIDNVTRQILTFVTPLAKDSYKGMLVYKEGEPESAAPIDIQTETTLRSLPEQTFAAFEDGDVLHVGYQMDEMLVTSNAVFNLLGQPARQPIEVTATAALESGDTPVSFADGDLILQSQATLRGSFLLNNFQLETGSLNLNGAIAANQIQIASDAILRTPLEEDEAAILLQANTIDIAGSLLALGNPDANITAFSQSHGGYGGAIDYDTRSTYGSLYNPINNGRYNLAGGSVRLTFATLNLDGVIDASGDLGGSGGSILLEGDSATATMSGVGQLLADGGGDHNGYKTGGGGRIAVIVNDINGFSGNASATGGLYPATPDDPIHQAGAGTMFYRTGQWPNGRLVVDNGGKPTKPGSTTLPGLGYHTTDQPLSGSIINGSGLPQLGGLTGMLVAFPGDETRTILSNDADSLTLTADMPELATGVTYHGLHRFDVLEIRGAAQLKTVDAIEVLDQLILVDGAIESPELRLSQPIVRLENGASELYADPGLSNTLELDNFQLTVHFPIDLDNLTLRNGGALHILDASQHRVADVNVISGTFAVNGELTATTLNIQDTMIVNGHVTADNLTLGGSGVLRTPDGVDNAKMHIQAPTMDLAGSLIAANNPNAYNPTNRYDRNHAGIGGRRELDTQDTYGSLYRPQDNGSGLGAGGAIHLVFTQLAFDGDINADGNDRGAGGAVLLEGASLSGSGNIHAQGGSNAFRSGGGGRIALLVEDLTAFTGSVQARGGYNPSSDPDESGGAGTVFYRNTTWPNGRLVLDNGGAETRAGSTFLPSIGQRTTESATGDGPVLAGSGYPAVNSLVGMYVVIDDQEFAVNQSSEFDIQTSGSFPALNPGAAYSGLHIFDVLEIQGGANLKTLDAIRVLEDLVQGDGSIDSPDLDVPVDGELADGSAEYFEDPGFTSLELSNFQLTVHFPLDLDRLVLNNGSTLTTDSQVNANTVLANDGEIIINGAITAQSLTVSETAIIRTPENLSDAGILLDVSGPMRILGTVRAQRNPNSHNPNNLYNGSHGGYSGGIDFDSAETYGSLYAPMNNGIGDYAGGRLHLRFDTLELTGSVNTNAVAGRYNSGGAILLEGNRLFGAGDVSADANSEFHAGGGGRIAVLVTDINGFTGQTHAYGGRFAQSHPQNNGGAGTVFFRTADWPNGRLLLDNNGTLSAYGSTELPALGQRSVDTTTGGAQISGTGFPQTESLSGMHVLFNDGTTVAIEAQDAVSLTAAGSFPALNPGDTYSGIHILDVLEIRGEAHFKTLDAVRVLQELVVDGGSLDTPTLEPPPGYTLSNGRLELFTNPGLTELSLDNFNLTTHFPMDLTSITLNNGAQLSSTQDISATDINVIDGVISLDGKLSADNLTVAAAGVLQTPNGSLDSLLTVEADTISMGGTIRALNNGGTYNPEYIYDYSHGGFGAIENYDSQQTYGSLYGPTHPGRGRANAVGSGGAVRLMFQTMDLSGSIVANGEGPNAGGSILLEGSALTGAGPISANGGHDYNAGGGGRIALLVNDLSNFSGATTAFGGSWANGASVDRNAGAGTVFFRDQNHPAGRLLIDNSGMPSRRGSTQLPGLGMRTTQQAEPGGAITGADFPQLDSLLGMYVQLDNTTVAIESHNQTQINGAFPALADGTAYTGLHILDVLEVRGKGNLKTDDILRVGNLLVNDAALDTPALEVPNDFSFSNGALELYENPGLTQISLDNFQLVVHFPLDLTELILTNGATITSAHTISADNIEVLDGTITLDGTLQADRLIVAANGVLETPASADTTLTINADVIELAGEVRSLNNGATHNPDGVYNHNHGGFGGIDSFATGRTFGSFYAPTQPARRNAEGPGGVVRLNFQTLDLTGTINVNGTDQNAAGSILLEGATLTGNGALTANGGDGYNAGGGGRIAFLINDVDGFSGTAQTFGGTYSDGSLANRNGGAGTVFYRSQNWPNGRLVLDNNGIATRSGSTNLPSLGAQTAAQADGGATINGTDFPGLGGLTGMHVLFADDTTVAVLDHSQTQLQPVGTFPALNPGDTYIGIHILDVLEVRGNANLATTDAIRVLQDFILEDGAIDSPQLDVPPDGTLADGSVELFEDPGYATLSLDNFHLVAHFPIDVSQITLLNGSTLTTDNSIQAGQVNVVDGVLTMNGPLNADRLNVGINGILRTPADTMDAALAIDATEIVIAGRVQAQTNGASHNPDNRYAASHGGVGGGIDYETVATIGSLYQPATAGRGQNADARAGGVIAMNFTSLNLTGDIVVDGQSGQAGGSVLLDGETISGDGSVSANGHGAWPISGGGGRIAMLINDISGYSGTATAFGGPYSNGSIPNHNGAAGTLFYQTTEWPNGKLVLDNNGIATPLRSTILPGLGEQTADETVNDNTLTGNFPELGGLIGMHVRVDNVTRAIVHNTADSLQVDGEPLTLNAGQTWSGIHILDVLEVRGAANLYAVDAVQVLDSFSFDGGTVETAELLLPNGNFQNGGITLMTAPDQRDITLDNFNLTLQTPFDLDSLSLTNNAVLQPDAPVRATTINVAAGSSVSARSQGNRINPDNRWRGSHGGMVGNGTEFSELGNYGSLYQPQTHGRGANNDPDAGGALHLIFDTLNLEGVLDVNGEGGRSAGSILLEGTTLSGSGAISANGIGGWPASGGGGRVAVIVNDISTYTGAATAFGGVYSNGSIPNHNGGAGTVFYRTSQWPNGRLVMDNNGTETPDGSSPLPGVGERVVNSSDGSVIYDTNLPLLNGLAGLQLEFDDTLVAVNSNTDTQINLADFNLTNGASYVGLHLLDVLEVSGGAKLVTPDKIRVLEDFVLDGGSVDALLLQLPAGSAMENGSATMLAPPDSPELILDNFILTVRTDLNLDSLTLRNGSVIDVDRPLNATHISVDATSTIRARSEGNQPNPDNRYRGSHGGLVGDGTDLSGLETFGSLYRPETHGRATNADPNAGGALHLIFDTLDLQGRLEVDGESLASGGSILLEGATLIGPGSVSANGNGGWPRSGAGGRIAILVNDISAFSGPVSAHGGFYHNGSLLDRNGGAGTVFYRTSSWPNGKLVLDNNGTLTRPGSTVLPGLGERVVSQIQDGAISAGDLPALNGLAGIQLAFGDTLVPVTANTETQLLTAGSPDIQPGVSFHGVHLLDVLEVRGGANLATPDHIRVLGSFVLDDAWVDAGQLALPDGAALQNGSATLMVAPDAADLSLDQFQLTLRTPLTLTSLNLSNGSNLDTDSTVTATTINIDATSTIRAQSSGNRSNPDNRYQSSHGGLSGNGTDLSALESYGSPYQPQTHGRGSNADPDGGGAIHLVFDTLNLAGRLDVDGVTLGSGGSILLQGSTLTGSGVITANGHGGWPRSGGGGRIALLIQDISAFSGPVTAHGGFYHNASLPDRNGGAGTVFYRTNTWPNGRLVLDNNGIQTQMGSTPLPGIGPRIAAGVNGAVIDAVDLPPLGGLTGLQLEFGDSSAIIASHSDSQITLTEANPALTPGTDYIGLHLLDVLEVRGQANLTTIDKIRVLSSFVLDQGSLDAAALELPPGSGLDNGSGMLFVAPDVTDLSLTNFQLNAQTTFNLNSLTLEQGAVLAPNGTITANTINIDATSTIRSLSGGNRYNPGNIYHGSHGGLVGDGTAFAGLDTYGSLYRPLTHGRGNNADPDAGGAIHLVFTTLNLAGSLDANGTGLRSGGSILLEGAALTGSGAITANGDGGWPASAGGGRIALIVDDISAHSGPITAYGGFYHNGSFHDRNGGAGTLFYRTSSWPNGKLVLDNNGTVTLEGSTRLPGINGGAIDGVDGQILTIANLPALSSLTGLMLDIGGELIAVTSNEEHQLVLADHNVTIQAGTPYAGIHLLDELEIRGNASLDSVNPLRVLGNVFVDDNSKLNTSLLDTPGAPQADTNPTLQPTGGSRGQLRSVNQTAQPPLVADNAEDLVVDGKLILYGDQEFKRIALKPGAELTVEGDLRALYIDLWRATLILKGDTANPTPSLSAGVITARESQLYAARVTVLDTLNLDELSLLAPGDNTQLLLNADTLILNGRIDVSKGRVEAAFGVLQSQGGQVLGELEISGGRLDSIALTADRMISRSPLFLTGSILKTNHIHAPHLGLEHGSLLAPIPDPRKRMSLDVQGGILIDADSAIVLDGDEDQDELVLGRGGVLQLKADNLIHDGLLSASGWSKGGSVLVHVQRLSGSGDIDVRGGSGDPRDSGRINLDAAQKQSFAGNLWTGAWGAGKATPQADTTMKQPTPQGDPPPRTVVSADDMGSTAYASQGLVMVITTDQNLGSGKNLWLETDGKRYAVLAVTRESKTSLRLLIKGRPQLGPKGFVLIHQPDAEAAQ